ncbi:MAG: magnesium transporter [Armatimonadetes bacterium]|nr:magnesium transporter [Armatimonadota bacterium]
MPYVSRLLNKPVTDADGHRVGQVEDFVADLATDSPHPPVVAVVVTHKREQRIVPWSAVAALVGPAVELSAKVTDLPIFELGSSHFMLVRDVLDKQLIDTNGARVVRVNDLELAKVNGHFYVANVDIGGPAVLRRLGMTRLSDRLSRRRADRSPGVISWTDVELLPGDPGVRLRVPSDKIGDLHPADLAEIIHDLSRNESSRLLETLDVETVADALEEVEPEFQASLVETMSDDRVADVLEAMAPDEAADLLAELPQERSEDLLNLMEVEEATDVRRLLTYPEDSAGGIMNTEFATVPPELTAEQAIAVLRQTAHEAETIYYVYVVDAHQTLTGVFSLRELVLADPLQVVSDFMNRRVVTVHLDDTQEAVAQAVSKYNLIAVPVVDEQDRLQGVVTADDALDKIIPTSWKKRLPRFYH